MQSWQEYGEVVSMEIITGVPVVTLGWLASPVVGYAFLVVYFHVKLSSVSSASVAPVAVSVFTAPLHIRRQLDYFQFGVGSPGFAQHVATERTTRKNIVRVLIILRTGQMYGS